MSVRRVVPRVALAAVFAVAPLCFSCASSSSGVPDGGVPACDADGVYLNIFGKAKQDLRLGQSARLKVVLTKRGTGHFGGEFVAGHAVHFQLGAGAPEDFILEADTAESDNQGIAQVQVQAGQIPAPNVQVTASTGSCNATFSIAVLRPVRRLTFVGQDPRDAYTDQKIMITAEATTDGGAALPGETVTFALATGATTTTRLSETTSGGQAGSVIEAVTGTNGRASVRLETGSEATVLTISADMAETAGDTLEVRIAERTGGSGCHGDYDCPGGYMCEGGVCVDIQTGGCQSDADCTSPAKCIAGKCLPPDVAGKPCTCTPSANLCTGCDAGEVCIGGYCTPQPGPCATNDDCPIGFGCVNGSCAPVDQPCNQQNCPAGWICQAGQCQPPGTECGIQNRPTDRLQGTWAFDSIFNLYEAVNPIFGAFLGAGSVLQDIIDGTFGIQGVPDWVTDFVAGFIRDLMAEYVPPWGFDLIQVLSDLDEILNTMRVWSTVQLVDAMPDIYRASEHWDLVGFKFHDQDIVTAPEDIPEIGTVEVEDYIAREICGVFYADKHHVKNAVGGLVKWAVEVALTAITCSGGGPCYTSIDDALNDLIDCVDIGYAIDDLVQGLFEGAPDVSGTVTQLCDGLKGQLITLIDQTLANIEIQLALMTLRGKADISALSIPQPPTLDDGQWNGTLAGGNFSGTFKATRQ